MFTIKVKLKTVLVLFVFLCLQLGNGKTQEIDSLMKFASEYPEQFWRILSKYHDFSSEEIQFYQDDIYLRSLGKNPYVDWDDQLIEKYKYELSIRNKGINWTEELIDKYKNENWFKFSEMYFDRELTISKKFARTIEDIEKYNSMILKEDRDSISYYYPWKNNDVVSNILFDFGAFEGEKNKLVKFRDDPIIGKWLDHDINLVPDSIVDYLANNINRFKMSWFGDYKVTWSNYATLAQYDRYGLNNDNNISFYKYLIKPELSAAKLKQIYELENERIFYYEAQFSEEEDLGYYPEVVIPREVYQVSRKKDIELFDLDGKVFDLKSAGALRYCDIIFDRLGDFNTLFLSDNAYSVFNKFALPAHKVFKVELRVNHPWYSNHTMAYHLLVLERDLKHDQIDIKNSVGIKVKDKKRGLFAKEVITDETFKEVLVKHKFDHIIKSDRDFRGCDFSSLALNQYLDLIPNTYLRISERLKKAIELSDLTGLDFRKHKKMDYVFNGVEIKDVDLKMFKNKKSNPLRNQELIKIFRKEKEKIISFSETKIEIKKLLKNRIGSPSDSISMLLNDFQVKNEVVLPKSIISKISSNKSKGFKTFGVNKEPWEWIPPHRLEVVIPEWYKYQPQLYKAICIGENGLGDYVVLLRETDSSYRISENLAILWHETGIVELLKNELNNHLLIKL